MPFNGSGTFSIINSFVPSTTILSAAVNQNFTDIATGLSDCLTRDNQAGMLAVLRAVSGTAALPSYTFTSDVTSGLYLVGSGQLGVSSNGLRAATFDAAQILALAQSVYATVLMNLNTGVASTSSNINALATAGTGAIAIGTSTSWATNGYLLCGNEVMSYTVASANGLTINTRGDMGTTSVTHAASSAITPLYTAMSYRDILLPSRATANRATAPAPGDFAYNTGSNQPEFYNSVTWVGVAPPNIVPQIYVSATASSAVITADTTATNLYILPNGGNLLPVPTAGVYSLQTLTTVATAAMSATQATAGIFDLYAFVSGGSLTFGYSPNWSAGTGGSVTTGSCARGTGSGGTVLTTASGFYVNGVGMTLNNGATTYTIATASGLYLGSVMIGATAGSASFTKSYGQNRQWPFWNNFNRMPIFLKAGDATASWNYNSATVRASDNDAGNSLMVFTGLPEETADLRFTQSVSCGAAACAFLLGIGYNSTATASGFQSRWTWGTNVSTTAISMAGAQFLAAPALGKNNVTSLEATPTTGGASNQQFNGTQAYMVLTGNWRG